MLPQSTADTPPPARGTPGVPMPVEGQLRALASGALAWFALAMGALLVVLSLGQIAGGAGNLALAYSRVLLGLALCVAAGIGWWLRRRGLSRIATLAIVLGIAAAAFGHAWVSGLGMHNIVIAGFAVLLALAGAMLGPALAAWLISAYVALVGTLAWAEAAGMLAGRQALVVLDPLDRLLGLAVLGVSAWAVALVIHRVLARALQDARAEQLRLADLLRIGSDWVWQIDERGRLTELSPSFEVHTGHRVADFLRLGEPGAPQVVEDDDCRRTRAALRERRAFRDLPMTYRLPDGRELHVRSNGEPQHDATGKFRGWWGMSRNVTREVLAERVSRRERDMVQRLFDLSPDPICLVELVKGRVLLANPAFIAATGKLESEVVGRNGRQLGLWQDNEDDLRLQAALRDSGGRLRNWRTALTLRGEVRSVLLSAASFQRDGQPVAMLVVHDVTEAERSRAEADAILDNASIGIALVRARRFERVNPAFEQMFGHSRGTLAGQPTAVMFDDPARHAAFIEMTEAARQHGRTVDVEREVRRHDGGTLIARLRGHAVEPQRPQQGGTIWLTEDITERRRGQQELAAAKQQAEAASHAKSAFLATMSHEIRTPLNGVLGLARLLQDERDERRRGDYLQHLVGAAEGLAGLVSDVLDLSKIEAGRVALEDIDFDLHALARGTFHTFAPLGQERGLAMECRIAPDVPQHVRGDPVRVRQILSNYLNNALKFTARGAVSLVCDVEADGAVRLSVVDSGIGIERDSRARLFQPFSQADSSTTRRFGGTGLGLSICRELALLMGGRVGADSEPGRGSTFWVALPLRTVGGAPATAAPQAEAALALAGMTVLVAEDNPVNMLIARTLLERLGAQVLEAADGAQAVARACAAMPALDAVLMDLHMPVQDGLDAARALRANAATAGLPLIALSAAVLELERSQARSAGLDDFLHKPVSQDDLLRVLAPLARRRRN
jgi:PAS domain S-box-containing protein